jgi:Fibronectin type III domain.
VLQKLTTALIKQVRKVTVDWDPITLGGAALTSYQVETRFSSDGGSTWDNSFTQIGTTNSSTTIFTTEDLNIAKTYQFRVRAVTDVGNTNYSDTENLTAFNSVFISAYGYRHDGTNFNTAIQFAARYTGDVGDTIVVGGTTYTGWKTIENVKRYDGEEFISLTQ